MKRLILLLWLLGAAVPAFGQVVSQGQPGVTSDARAWPFKIVFAGAQIDPRDMTDRAARLVGKITFNGAQPVTQSGGWSISFTAPQHIICDSGCASPPAVPDSSGFIFGASSVNIIAGVVDDVATNTVAEDNYAAPRITDQRALHVNLRTAAGNEFGTGADPVGVYIADSSTALVGNVRLEDGVSLATIKPASTLPLATDTALVVTQRDAIPAGANVIGHVLCDGGCATGGLLTPGVTSWTNATPTNSTLSLTLAGTYQTAVFSALITGGTFNLSGSVAFEGSVDGATYLSITGIELGAASTQGVSSHFPTSTNKMFAVDVTGLKLFRLRLTAPLTVATGTPALGLTLQASTLAASPLRTSMVTAITLPLPTGAATSAAQPAFGVAGTASADVLTVQGRAAMTPLLVDPSAVTSPVSLASVPSHNVTNAGTFAVQATGTVTTAPPANASTNVAQLAGTATSVNSGLKDAGTLRVVLATDQPALTNKLLVTPDSVALPANQSVNVAQMGGVATSMNTGVRDTGTQRVTIATNDLVPISGTVTTTPPANASSNVAQFGGTNVSTGTGTGGAGIPRVTTSSDSSLTANQGTAAASTAGWPATAGNVARATTTWSSATALNTALTMNTTGYSTIVLSMNDDAGTFTTGVLNFEVSDDNTHWYSVLGYLVGGLAGVTNATFTPSLSVPFIVNVTGFTQFRLRLSPAITGTGNATVALLASAVAAVPVTNNIVSQGAPPWAVSVPTLTKGTQGAQGVTTQDLHDAGRTLVTFTADNVVPVLTTDTLVTFTKLVGDTSTGAVTTYPVTSGKTLRLTSLSFSMTPSSTTASQVRLRLRTLTTSPCIASSPLVGVWSLSSPIVTSAASAGGASLTVPFPDGMEFSGATRNLCLSMNALTSAAQLVTVTITGYEY